MSYNKGNTPKTLKLWFSTRKFGELLSGNGELTDAIKLEIKNDCGFNIGKDDINMFPLILSTFKPYVGIFYRGVPKNDKLYIQLKEKGCGKTYRYYACSLDVNFAQCFGEKILIVFDSTIKNFNVSLLSREREVILDKGIECVLTKIENVNGYEKLYVKNISIIT